MIARLIRWLFRADLAPPDRSHCEQSAARCERWAVTSIELAAYDGRRCDEWVYDALGLMPCPTCAARQGLMCEISARRRRRSLLRIHRN